MCRQYYQLGKWEVGFNGTWELKADAIIPNNMFTSVGIGNIFSVNRLIGYLVKKMSVQICNPMKGCMLCKSLLCKSLNHPLMRNLGLLFGLGLCCQYLSVSLAIAEII